MTYSEILSQLENMNNQLKNNLGNITNTFHNDDNIEDYSDNEKKILMTLREYGINIKELVNQEMLKEIEANLNVRFSTYDIVNAIKKLSTNSKKYNNNYYEIIEKYIGEY